MAAMLNSYLGNLDRVPQYIDECKRLGIEILKPDINKSFEKFTVADMPAMDGVTVLTPAETSLVSVSAGR